MRVARPNGPVALMLRAATLYSAFSGPAPTRMRFACASDASVSVSLPMTLDPRLTTDLARIEPVPCSAACAAIASPSRSADPLHLVGCAWLSMTRGLIILMVLLFTHTGCYRAYPPQKPRGVPPEATWAGGLDGGAFIHCDVDHTKDVNRCRVWNDFTGQLIESGEYRLLKEGRAAKPSELVYSWADFGGWIGLEHGLVLANLDGRHP